MPRDPYLPTHPVPGKPVVQAYSTPNLNDRIYIVRKDTREAGYELPAVGDPYDGIEAEKYQDFKFSTAKPSDQTGWIDWVYVNDRKNQDDYNFAMRFNSDSIQHRVYIRTYVEDRATYTPVAKGTPDSADADAVLTIEEMTEVDQVEYKSLYVQVVRTFEVLPGPWIPQTRYDQNLGPVQGQKRFVVNTGQVTTLGPTGQTTYEGRTELTDGGPRQPSSYVLWEIEENWSNGTGTPDEYGPNDPYPIVVDDIYDDAKGKVHRVTQLVVLASGQDGSLTVDSGGVITKTEYVSYNPFLRKKVVETWVLPGPALEDAVFDQRYGVPFTVTTQPEKSAGLVGEVTNEDGVVSLVETKALDVLRSDKITTQVSVPEQQVSYGRRREALPIVLTGLALVGTETKEIVPNFLYPPTMPLLARYTSTFFFGIPPEPDVPTLADLLFAQPFRAVVEYTTTRNSVTASTGTHNVVDNSSGTANETETSSQNGTHSGTENATRHGETTGKSSGTTNSTTDGTSNSTGNGTSNSTHSTTGSGTQVANNTGSVTRNESGTSSTTSSGTRTDNTSGTSTGTSNVTKNANYAKTSSTSGAPLTSDPHTNVNEISGETSNSNGTNSRNETGNSSGTGNSTHTTTDTGSHVTSENVSHTTTEQGISNNTDVITRSGTEHSTRSASETGTHNSSEDSTSSGTTSGTTSGTNNSTRSTTRSGATTSTGNSTNNASNASTATELLRLELPPCLRSELSVAGITVPATTPENLPWGEWVIVSQTSQHWKNNVWVTETVEVKLPSLI